MCPLEDDCFDFRNYGTPFYDDIRQYVYIVIINLKQRDLHIITSCYYKYIAQEEFIYHNMKSVKLHVNYKDMYMLLQIYYNKCTIVVSITISYGQQPVNELFGTRWLYTFVYFCTGT